MLKLITRKLIHNRLRSCIIIGGMSIALSVCILITLYVDNELNYDRHYNDFDKISRIITSINSGSESQDMALAPIILGTHLKEIPEIENVGRVSEIGFKYNIIYKDKVIVQEGIRDASPEILKIFSFTFLAGSPEYALKDVNSIVLTESLSKKLFGNSQNALDELISLNNNNYRVTAVINDLPKNSDLQFSALLAAPFKGDEELLDLEAHIYIKTNGADENLIADKINGLIKTKYKNLLENELKDLEFILKVQPIEDVHFCKGLLADNPKGNKANLYIFSLIALFVLLLACINYINLNLAGLSKRIYYIGLCKISGAKKIQLIIDNIIETLVVTSLSLFIAIGLSIVFLPFLNHLTSNEIEFVSIFKLSNVLTILSLLFIVNIITGVLPSFALSKASTIEFLKQMNQLGYINRLRKPLIVIQFVISIIMISGLLIFQKQLLFMKNKDLGYKHQNIIALELPSYDTTFFAKVNVFVDDLRQVASVKDISQGSGSSFFGVNHGGEKILFADDINGRYKQFVISVIDIDDKFIDFMGIELLKGENFMRSSIAEQNVKHIIINESYAKAMELGSNPVGKKTNDGEQIIGLVKDFNYTPLTNKIEPVIFRFSNNRPDFIYVKTKPENIDNVKTVWEKHLAGYPYIAKYLTDSYWQGYKSTEKDLNIIQLFTLISILTTCIGLFGLILFIADNKTKEIGVRKVNGAKVNEIISMLNKGFIESVILSFVIATPISWYVMGRWLENFAYKTDLSWWIFVLAGIVTLFITLITVSWQSWLAARRNPVEALRYE